jgi:hypothetical protein
VLLVAIALALPAGTAPAGLAFAPTAAEQRRLDRGEAVVRMGPVQRGGLREGVAMAVLDSPPARIHRALVDLDHYAEWVPFLSRTLVRRVADSSAEQEQWLHLRAPLADRHYRLRADWWIERGGADARWRLRWRHVPGSGNLRDHRGEWTLVGLADGRTLAACRLYVDPGGHWPSWLTNRVVARALPWLLDGLRQQAHRWRYNPRAPAGAE